MNSAAETHEQNSIVGDFSSPPILKSWVRLYAFVLAELALLIALFYAFSRFYQ